MSREVVETLQLMEAWLHVMKQSMMRLSSPPRSLMFPFLPSSIHYPPFRLCAEGER